MRGRTARRTCYDNALDAELPILRNARAMKPNYSRVSLFVFAFKYSYRMCAFMSRELMVMRHGSMICVLVYTIWRLCSAVCCRY